MEPLQNPSQKPEHCYLPPDLNRQADFSHLLRQMDSEYFVSSASGRGLRLFQPAQSLPLQNNERTLFEFSYPAFIVVGGDAYQLSTDVSRLPATKFFSSSLSISRSGENMKVLLERDFDRCYLRHAYTEEALDEFTLDTSKDSVTAVMTFHPLPARTAALLRHETLGYIYIGSERIGAHPKPRGTMTTSFRIFHGGPDNWQESDVYSAIISGRGLGNWRYQTGIGDFFIPGGGGIGDPQHTFKGKTVSVTELDESHLDISSPYFEPLEYNIFRTLGVPAQWPPFELLSSL